MAGTLANGAKCVRLDGRLLKGRDDSTGVEVSREDALVIGGRGKHNFSRHVGEQCPASDARELDDDDKIAMQGSMRASAGLANTAEKCGKTQISNFFDGQLVSLAIC